MLRIENLVCHSDGKSLLDIEGLQLKGGETLAVLGPNGAGKSTLLRAVSGDCGYDGEVLVHGRNRRHWRSNYLARHLGVLPQASVLTFPFLAHEVVSLGAIPLKLSQRCMRAEIRRVMELCDCDHLSERHFPSLSGGEKQRVQLARVLLQLSQAEESPLLLLDEPTSAQDLGHQHHMLRLTNQLAREGYGVISILHDLNHTLHYCKRCIVLENGRVRYQGQPDDVLVPEHIGEIWNYRPAYGWLQDDRLVLA
ncbi:heme ABC transporter ATP-binding protein [Marinobacterium mangrovicola]|uniref:Iron complex transport system ATP-binding protein n=1 Tax=Marinobacterium mangrovicola TaxID=1476959 RepID=A0A4R1G7J8_9GAMM|nr:heme ABC transporter ATP-binding protein [Marinobacterium mangrovicola]TCK04057.1 iron complex transport system ATP-binding protein [Marinobacterium mangrovicola]